MSRVRNFHAARWDEPVILQMGAPGRRGVVFPEIEPGVASRVGSDLVPGELRRRSQINLPEMSEPEVLNHYLHLSQETLGMVGVSLFGTCTMKYNPRVNEALTSTPQVTEVHPYQPDDSIQGTLEIIHRCDVMLRELSGMHQFVFQAGGGAHAAYNFAALLRSYLASSGELGTRDQVIVTIQTHPSASATAAAAGFEVITLPIEEAGYPSLDALRAAVSDRTAGLIVNNPDDMGIYNPYIKDWVDLVHEAGGLCFYDHANANGVMGKIRASELGFDACMYMLHKSFGAPKGGLGPAVGAFGCTEALAAFLPTPVVQHEDGVYILDYDRPKSLGKIREFFGNVPQIIKAYSWLRAMGADGINEARDISVLTNNYMEKAILAVRGITKSNPDVSGPRMEMTRYSLETLFKETGVSVMDVIHRMTDYGVDAPWLSHEPWLVPEPLTPEAGETWSLDAIDEWVAVLAQVCNEAYTDPEVVRTAPHRQAIGRVDVTEADEADAWALTWRAFVRKHGAPHLSSTSHGPDSGGSRA